VYVRNRKETTPPDYVEDYVYTAKNECGQVLVLEIYLKEYSLNKWYNVAFHIASKRKRGWEDLKQTGKDGLKSLLWAKACVKDFIKNYPLDIVYPIRIEADDSRRFKIYERKLKDLGFVKYSNKNILIKR
jgi:hypothetical protein